MYGNRKAQAITLTLYFAILVSAACLPVQAHDVITTKITWSREISRLVYKRCVSCHRDGGSAFSLVSYAEARPWAKAIKEETLERRMPPWNAVKGFGSFRDDQGLTQEDLELISGWVEGGSPEGDPALVPKPPDFTDATHVKEATGPEIVVDGRITLQSPVLLTAIGAKSVAAGKSVQVIALLPDGTVDPLIWIYNYNPTFARSYVLKTPLNLPAGTRIVCSPTSAGAISLFTGRAVQVVSSRR
jgi:hypothetical protein